MDVAIGKVFVLKKSFTSSITTMIQGKINDAQNKVGSGRVIYGKEGFTFSILSGLKN